MEEDRAQAGVGCLEGAEHRVALAHLEPGPAVVVERQDARDLVAHGGRIPVAVQLAGHDAVGVLAQHDAGVAREAVAREREPHRAVEVTGPRRPEPEPGGPLEREGTGRPDREVGAHPRGRYATCSSAGDSSTPDTRSRTASSTAGWWIGSSPSRSSSASSARTPPIVTPASYASKTRGSM